MFNSTTIKSVLTVMLLIASISAGSAFAKRELVATEGAKYNANASIADNLKIFTGKKVYLKLASGQTIGGYVKIVGQHLVHIEKLDQKDFFDALVKIDTIDAIDTQFRQYK